jgi:hypothetical protein
LLFAFWIACFGALISYGKFLRYPEHPGDFGVAWFGARALLNHANPYLLIGPGKVYDWPWEPLYPATAMVAAIPFAPLPQTIAIITFVFISSGILAYAVSRDGWYRWPMFITTSFVGAAGFAQWTSLLTAGFLIPSLALVFAAKPNLGAALDVAGLRRHIVFSIAGGIVLSAIAFALLPSWFGDWRAALRSGLHLGPPILTIGGPAILLAFLRWRRWEAWLILGLACVPQTMYWYEALPLFLVPATLGQSMVLALIAATGMLIEQHYLVFASDAEHYHQIGTLMVALIYLPATILVLRRPNCGPGPAWLDWLLRLRERPAAR